MTPPAHFLFPLLAEKAKKRPPPSRFAALRRGVTSAMPIRASSEDGEDNAGDGSDVVNNADEVSSEELGKPCFVSTCNVDITIISSLLYIASIKFHV